MRLSNKLSLRTLVASAAIISLATARLEAYVDPGIVGALYQAAYALVFGALTAWVFRPWRYLVSLFRRRRADVTSASGGHRLNHEP
jgi:hypothetical protein